MNRPPISRALRQAGALVAAISALANFALTTRADDSSLVGLWHFDETTGTVAADSSGNGNNGTNTAITFTAGQVNGAFNFNGNNSAVNAGNGSSLNNPAGVTIAAWIKPTGFGGGGGFGRIVDKVGYRLAFANNALDFVVTHSTTNFQRRSVSNVITLNAWQHVAVTWDGSSTATNAHIYVNGTEVSSYAISANAVGTRNDDSASTLTIGNVASLIRGFAGAMDEVYLYNRALSAAEVHDIYAPPPPDSAPVISTTSLPNGTVGAAYSQTLAATGGNGALVWSLDSGSLPAGLSLSPGGIISGTPTTAGTSNFIVRVGDSDATTSATDEATQALSLTVDAPPTDTAPVIATTSLPAGTIGVAYSQTLTATGGNGTLSWSLASGSLPTGMTLSSNGTISGTPTATGSSSFSVRVADSDGNTSPSDEDVRALTLLIDSVVLTANVVTNRTGGVAPLAVHFDASTTTDSITTRPFHDLDYRWNFGDPSSGIWAVSGKSKNTDKGPIAGHVFETPGVYTVTLTVKDAAGTTATKIISITVTDPNAVFSGANTICISTSGNFTGAPAGAQQVTSSSWSSIINSLGTGKRVLLRRGETWTHDGTTKNMNFNGPGILGAFGSGPRPILKMLSAGNGAFRLGTNSTPNQFTDFRFMDFEVDGNSVDRVFASAEGTIHDITFLHINAHDSAGFLSFGTQVLQFANNNGNPGHTMHTGVAMVETDFDHLVFNNNINGVCFNQSFLLGNTMNDSQSGEHVLRIFFTQHLVFAHNRLTECAVGKHLLKLHAADVTGLVPAGEIQSKYIVISDNVFSTSIGNWPVAIGPQNDTTSEVVENVILDSNHLVFAGGTGLQVGFILWGSEITARNNTAVLTNPGTNGVTMFAIGQRGIEPPPHDTRFYNNSAYVGSSTNSFARLVSVSSSASNTVVRNNLLSAPGVASKGVIGGTGPNLQQSNNLETNTPGWMSASPASGYDFRLAAGSPAIDGGTSVPVLADFSDTTRPLDSAWDIGAFEYNSASATTPVVTIAASVSAASEPATNGQFVFTASPAPASPITVNLSIGGTATNGVDYTTIPTTVVIGPSGSTVVDATVLDDTNVEGSETIVLSVLAGTGYTLGSPNAAAVTIADDEIPNSVPAVITTSLPNAIVGVSYSQTLLGSGGDGTLVWSLDSGTLPAGLSLSSAGMISGTPTALGTSSFTVRLADSDANVGAADEATGTLSIAVLAGDSVVATAGGGFLNTPFVAQTGVFTASFDLTPSASPMSANVGLSDGSVTAFSGMATIIGLDASGGYFVARNGGAYTFTAPSIPYAPGQTYHFRLAINIPLHTYSIFVTPPGGPELTLGSNFAFRTEQNAVTTLNNWIATTASPSGASITINNFMISGGTVANSVPSITTTTLPGAVLGTTYSQTLAATGGDGALVWSVDSGTLPAGLTLSAGGLISGTPTTVGTSNFTLRVADSDAVTGSTDEDTRALSIVVTSASNVYVDENGWTQILPSVDSRIVYVSSSTGNDNNDGLTPATAKATIAAGDALIRDGFPDHLLLKRGDTFVPGTTTVLGRWKNGRSANEPMVVSYYGSSGPRPVVKLADKFIDHNGQARNFQAVIGLDLYKPTSDPSSPDFNSTDCTTGLRFIGGGADILVEDCRLRFVNLSVQSFPVGTSVYTNFKCRRNIITDNWVNNSYNDGNARVQGLFMSQVVGYLIEENVFDHNGWSEVVPAAGANQFNHNVYVQYDNSEGGVMRGNIFARGSAHGLQARAGGVVERNLFTQNAVAVNVGGVQAPTDPDVAGFPNRASQNVILEGRLMDPAGNNGSPRTSAVWGIWTAFINGVLLDDNIVANRVGNGSNNAINQQAPATLVNDIVYQWDPAYNTTDPTWPHPNDNLGDYYLSLGGADSTAVYLDWLRNRPLGELPWSMTAYSAINYIRSGFNKGAVTGYFQYDGQQVADTVPAITTTALPDGRVGGAYQAFLSATGGNGATVWTIVSGSLPAGLTMNTAGAITGTPTAAGSTTFTVRAADSDANTAPFDEATKTLTLNVPNAVPVITTTWLPQAKVGSVYSFTLGGGGGDGASVWSLAGGSLPAGVTLSSAGVLNGTAAVAGNYPLTFKVADSDVLTGPSDESTRDLILTVLDSNAVLAVQGGGFINTTFPVQTGSFTAVFDLIPSTSPMSANLGISNGSTTSFASMACIIGLDATGGYFVARNGGAYTFTAPSIPYVAGAVYHFRLAIDIATHHYSIYITPPGGPEQALGGNFAFRTEQAAVAQLDNWVVTIGGTTVGSSVGVFDFAISAGVPAIATTSLPNAAVGAGYSQALTASGGDGAYVWMLDSGSLPPGLSLSSAGVISGTPTATGSSTFTVRVADSDGVTGAIDEDVRTLTLVVDPGAAVVTLSNLVQAYDGTPRSVAVEIDPAGLAVSITYDGSATAPTYPGLYAVVATITDSNYAGTATGTLTIRTTALVRHAPSLNDGLDGSLQVLLGEDITLNGNAWISGDLLVAGTPTLLANGNPTYVGVQDAGGSATPTGYKVTLNGNAVLRYLVRRIDPLDLPDVAQPPAPAGTLNVTLNSVADNVDNWATVRNLTLNGNAGLRIVPPGTYGRLTANGNSGFILGVAGATEPAVYNLQSLLLNGNSVLQVAGPVVLTVANGVNVNGSMGEAAHPEWLTLRLASGGLTLNGNVTLSGEVVAPSGTIIINGSSTLIGRVSADRLIINGNGRLAEPPPGN